MERIILHVDCNSFFASVEQVLNPALKNVPMSVGGDKETRHGIILASNQLAKKEGVKTAETIFEAKKKCPSLVITPPHYDEYEKFSIKCYEIYNRYTDLVEPFGIDECWLDVTKSKKLFGDGVEIGNKIRNTIKDELGLTVSVGVSFNKIFAKLGSNYKKPDALTEISKENFKEIVFPLNVEALMGVGRKTKAVLNRLGIRTIGGLARYDKDILIDTFGKVGLVLHNYANGLDDSIVDSTLSGNEKSIGNGKTFKRDVQGFDSLYKYVIDLSNSVGYRLRSAGYKTSLLRISIKDKDFNVTSHQEKIDETNIDLTIAKFTMKLVKNVWDERVPIRALTITAAKLSRDNVNQLSFFDDNKEKLVDMGLQKAVDSINKKYGRHTIKQGEQL